MGTGDYNLFCKGNKVLRNREGYDEIFGERNKMVCAECGTSSADRYHFRGNKYICTSCAKSNGEVIEERHVP
jgi:hypothetical protein|tara:strand:- start:1709 stop:1924 length:216 start_codon:yes stop_codon:yes gene_type:complete